MNLLFVFVAYWSLETTFLYVLMGCIGMWAIRMTNEKHVVLPFYKNKYYQAWFVSWTVLAAFRLIDGYAGGTDAYDYYRYFVRCFDIRGYELTSLGLFDSNPGFRWYNRIFSLVSHNEVYYLALTHGLMLAFVIKFIDSFKFKKTFAIPFFLIAFWYIRGFCTIRSHLATSIFLLSFTFFLQEKYKKGIITVLLSVLFHKMMILYALFVPFYLYVKDRKIPIKLIIIAIICISLTTSLLVSFVFGGAILSGEMSEHYSSYTEAASEIGFFGNFWKIAFEQILLGIFLLILRKTLLKYRNSSSTLEKRKFDLIWYACCFDMMMIPICSNFGIWRGYEIFYIPRLVMWGLIFAVKAPKDDKWKFLYSLFLTICIFGWFLQRISAESFWEATGLMPYLFRFFY